MIRLLFILLFIPAVAFSHELKPSIANFKFVKKADATNFKLKIQLNLEAILANIDPSHSDTDQSKNSNYYNQLRKLKPDILRNEFKKILYDFKNNIFITQADQNLNFNIDKVEIDEIGNIEVSRETIIYISGQNINKEKLKVGWNENYGPLILRVLDFNEEIVYTEYLKTDSISKYFSINNKKQSLSSEIYNYLIVGFTHIVPKGLDHILFVIGLFLFSPKFKPLLIQISAFTLAHTITIFLGVLNIIKIPTTIVEPIIALSISYIAIENIFLKQISIWRPIIVFIFGLLHGLGFAGVISEIGLSKSNFVASLVSFNVGVELGQLFIIAICYFGAAYWFKNRAWYKKFFTNPLSIIISIIGLYWFIERII